MFSRRLSNPASLALTGIALVGLLWSLRDTFFAMAGIWFTSASFNYCLLIAPASAVLIWRRRHRLAHLAPQASSFGVALYAIFALTWFIGAIGNVSTLQNLAVVAMIGATVWAIPGRKVAREIAFPLLFLLFMVPFGTFLVPWLMEFTANITVAAARASGVSVYKDGLFFTIPNGSFKIVEACSGLRMLTASIAIAVLFAHLSFVSWTRRIVFVLATIVVSLIANGLRAYIVVMVGYYSGMQAIADHVLLGYFVFGFVIITMILIGSRYADFDAASFARVPESSSGEPGSLGAGLLASGVVLAIVFAMPAGVSAVDSAAREFPPAPPLILPAARGSWSGPQAVRDDWAPRYFGHEATRSGTYRAGATAVDAFVLSWSRQEQGAELISAKNRVSGSKRWMGIREDPGGLTFASGRTLDYVETEVRLAVGGKRLIRHWYIVDGRPVWRPSEIKLREMKNSILGRPTPGALVAVSVRFVDDRAAAARTLDSFIEEVYAPAYLAGDAPE